MELSTFNTIILIILASCSILISFFHLYNNNDDDDKDTPHLPPGNLGLPFLGETLQFMRAGQKGQPENFILDRMTRHNPVIFKTSILGEPTAVPCGAAGHKFTFGHEDKLLVSWWPRSVDLIFPTTSRTSSNEETKRLRRLLPQFLRPEALKRYVGVMDTIVNRHIRSHWEGKDVVYVYTLAKNVSFWVACRVFLSMDDPCKVHEFGKPFETLADGIVSLPVNLPGTRLNRAIKAAKQVREEIRAMIEERRRDLAKGTVSRNQDIMSHMLVTIDEEDGKQMNDDDIADKLLALLFGGHQTTSVAITFVIKFLAELPHVFHAVFQEQMEIARSKGSDEALKWEDVQKMKYTWNVACEALRLAPPVQGAFRIALQDFSYGGYHIPKGWKVQVEGLGTKNSTSFQGQENNSMRKIKHNEVMKAGARIYVPVSIAESRISRRFDHIPCGTLYPNADEIAYLQRLVMYKDSAIIVLNKPPKLPLKGNLPVHNSMDALAAAALSYDNEEGPRLVHRLDRESSGILLMGRTKESTSHLQQLFSNIHVARTSCQEWNDACDATYMKYWALVIGSPKVKEGYICAPLTKVLLDDGKTERVMLAHSSGLEACQEAVTEYRVLGPMINGCSWVELRPHTSRKHQLRVHCAEALGTPIVGDYKYGWFVHQKWKQTPQVNIEPRSGEPYKLRRPDGLDIQKGSVLSKVPLLHLCCRELVLPNIAKFLGVLEQPSTDSRPKLSNKPDVLRFVALMPSHMKISWNLMSSYLV